MLCITLILLLCTSCTTEERLPKKNDIVQNSKSDTSSTKNSDTKKYKKELTKNLLVDAEINTSNISEASILKASAMLFDNEKLLDVFFGTRQVNQKKEGAGTTYSDGSKSLVVLDDKSYFDFHTPLKSYIEGIINTNDFGNLSKFKAQELEFMSKEDAINKADSIIKTLGITPFNNPEVYSMDYRTLQQEQEIALENGIEDFVNLGKIKLKENWTKDDEFYYLSYKVDIGGIMCDPLGYTQMPSGLPIDGSKIEVIISKNGVELLKTTGIIYKPANTDVTGSRVISVEQALESVKKKFDNVILINKATITNISFIYTPSLVDPTIDKKTGAIKSKQINLIPAWLFKIQQKRDGMSEGSTSANSYVRINALTGDEIL